MILAGKQTIREAEINAGLVQRQAERADTVRYHSSALKWYLAQPEQCFLFA